MSKRILGFFLAISLVLTSIGFILMLLKIGQPQLGNMWLIKAFDLDGEQNIPSWYQSTLLLFCSILLWNVAIIQKKQSKKDVFFWSMLACIFLYLSFDEVLELHERRPLFYFVKDLGDIEFVVWSPAIILLPILLCVFFWKHLWNLPRQIKKLFFMAALFYLIGVFFIEILEETVIIFKGINTLNFQVLAAIEEFFEMIGLNIFIYGLLQAKEIFLKNKLDTSST